mmetsp:Transcript_646/g.1515  ORF Transcript_646/g.1515 Transcript_646/m.1515 type:complete len:117 (-) Transcript_646:187-537(-)
MLPTLSKSGDVVVLEHMPFQWNKYKAGDIVVATSPHDPTKSICKRVLGLEGDTVSYTSGFISSKVKVPEGHVWLQGDNDKNSTDSRHYGPVPSALIRGRVRYRVWPLSKAGWIGHP